MENSRYGQGPEEDDTLTSGTPAERSAEFARSWRIRAEKHHRRLLDKKDDDDEEEDEKEKQQRVVGFARRLPLIAKDDKEQDPPKQVSEHDLDVSLPEVIITDKAAQEMVDDDGVDPLHAETTAVEVPEQDEVGTATENPSELAQEAPDMATVADAGPDQDADEEDRTTARVTRPLSFRSTVPPRSYARPAASSRSGIPLMPPPPPPIISGSPYNIPPTGNTIGPSPNVAPMPAASEVASPPTLSAPNRLPSHEHEHTHPLAIALGVGLLLEHYFRKEADKDILEQMQRRTDKIREQIQKNQTVQNEMNQRLEARQEVLQREQDRQRYVLERPQPVASTERITQIGKVEQKRSVDVAPVDDASETVTVPNTERYAKEHKAPIVVMEQIAAAAEKDLAVERVYERRQEVRDEPGNGSNSQQGGGAMAGPALQKRGTTQGDASGYAREPSVAGDSRTPGAHRSTSPYKSAMAAGFGVAVALIVLALIAYTVMK